MPRNSRPLIILPLCAGFLLAALVTAGPLAGGRASDRIGGQAPPGFADAEVVETHDLATLRPADAARLDGRRCRWRVTMAGSPDRQGDRDRTLFRFGELVVVSDQDADPGATADRPRD